MKFKMINYSRLCLFSLLVLLSVIMYRVRIVLLNANSSSTILIPSFGYILIFPDAYAMLDKVFQRNPTLSARRF